MLRKKYLIRNKLSGLNVIVSTNQPSINIKNSQIKNSPFYLFQANDGVFKEETDAEVSRTILDPAIFIDKESRIAFQEQVDYFYRTVKKAESSNYKGWEETLGNMIVKLNNPDSSYEDRLNAVNTFQDQLKPLSSSSKVLKKIGLCLAVTATIAIACTAIAALLLITAMTINLIGIAGVALFTLTAAMKVTEELVNNSRFFKKEDRRKIHYGIFRDNEIKDKSKQDRFFEVGRQAVYAN